MTKKDYNLIAFSLAESRRNMACDSAVASVIDQLIRDMARNLADENSRFDTAKFCQAAMTAPNYKQFLTK